MIKGKNYMETHKMDYFMGLPDIKYEYYEDLKILKKSISASLGSTSQISNKYVVLPS